MPVRRLLWLVPIVLACGCDGLRNLAAATFLFAPPLGATYLRYDVESPRGAWTREFAMSGGAFAERRYAAGKPYAVGLLGREAWMRVGSRAPVEIDGTMAADQRTLAAWIGMQFGDPEHHERPELETCNARVCTLVYAPKDGHALWIDVDRGTHRPVSFQWIAQGHSIEACDAIAWTDGPGAPAIASAECSAIIDHVGRETTRWTLAERRDDPIVPEWAKVARSDVVPLRAPGDAARFPIADPSTRVYVPIDAGGSPLQLVLDTGASRTVLSRRVLAGLGVVRSPDPPVHVKPPWLPEDTYDPVIVDRLTLGDIDLHGVSVLVARSDAAFASDEAGLLGMDLLSRWVVDVDGPASTLRIWPRELFHETSFTDLPYRGASHGAVVVRGEVDEIGAMSVIVDTGAPLNVVVGGPAMHAKHPHHRGDDVFLREDSAAFDYATEVTGFHLGPFWLPRMPATGHDRRPDLPFLDGDAALVGLGVLRHFRVVVDSQESVVHVAPGPSYRVLTELGVEIDDRGGAPTVTRVVDGEHEWSTPLREGDVVKSVGGKAVHDRTQALAALAAAPVKVRLVLERRGNRLVRTFAMR